MSQDTAERAKRWFRDVWGKQRSDAAIDVLSVENVVASGDDAVVRWRFTGTHRGTIFGVTGSGRPIDVHGMTWLRFRDGKIVEGWDGWNVGGLVQHLSQPAVGRDRSAAG